MRRFHPIPADAAIAIASAQTSLPFPPTSFGLIPDSWRSVTIGEVSEFDLNIWAADTVNLTAARLYAGKMHDFVLADDDVDTVDYTNNELDLASHAYATGDGPVQLTTTDTLPTGLSLLTDYYVIVVNSGTIKLATSFALALAGTAVEFDDAGTGTHTISDVDGETQRMFWHDMGYMGIAKDGAISLTAMLARLERVSNSPGVIAYAVSATLSSAVATSVEMVPVVER